MSGFNWHFCGISQASSHFRGLFPASCPHYVQIAASLRPHGIFMASLKLQPTKGYPKAQDKLALVGQNSAEFRPPGAGLPFRGIYAINRRCASLEKRLVRIIKLGYIAVLYKFKLT